MRSCPSNGCCSALSFCSWHSSLRKESGIVGRRLLRLYGRRLPDGAAQGARRCDYVMMCRGGLQGARFAKWRSVISIPAGPSPFALQDCAYGLARYAAIAQVETHS